MREGFSYKSVILLVGRDERKALRGLAEKIVENRLHLFSNISLNSPDGCFRKLSDEQANYLFEEAYRICHENS